MRASLGIRVVCKTMNTLRRSLVHVKTKLPKDKKEVVYTLPLKDCSSIYVGETTRNLKTRIAEHKYAVQTGDRKTGIAVHVQKEDYRIDRENAKVKKVVPHYLKEEQ